MSGDHVFDGQPNIPGNGPDNPRNATSIEIEQIEALRAQTAMHDQVGMWAEESRAAIEEAGVLNLEERRRWHAAQIVGTTRTGTGGLAESLIKEADAWVAWFKAAPSNLED